MSTSEPIIVVTGGNRGIGRELCRQLADEGYSVVLGSRDLRRGEQTATELGRPGVHAVQLDVTDEDSVRAV